VNINSIKAFIEKTWDDSVIPALEECIRIPAVSPIFDPDWQKSGLLLKIADFAKEWCVKQNLQNSRIRVVNEKGRTPALLIEIEAFKTQETDSILIYGHLDKQPEAVGWDENKGPWTPVIENDKLYGRGGADDCYAVFTAITAIKALQVENIPHKKCVLLIETCEESGSFDLEYYLEKFAKSFEQTGLIICLDSGCGDYERLWLTNSLRGAVVAQLKVEVLSEAVHSGKSGLVASSFRILRQLLDRIENSSTGEVLIKEFYTDIPELRMAQIRETAQILKNGPADDLPIANGMNPMFKEAADQIIESTWKPYISYTGIEGIPSFQGAANAVRPYTSLLLSIRIPPTLNPEGAITRMKTLLEIDPPFGAKVGLEDIHFALGWDMPQMGQKLEEKVEQAALAFFNKPVCYAGEGGTIPFMNLLATKFPDVKFVVTGIIGPHANAHGPNEFVDIPYAKKLNCAISYLISSE